MAALLMDALARRRAEREEAAARALLASSPELQRLLAGEEDGEEEAAPSEPFVAHCCFEGDESARPPAYPIEVLRDVDYSDGRSSCAKLDVYFSPIALRKHMRARGEASVPVTLHVHGGGWQRGHKGSEWRGGPVAGRASARHGLVACVVSYRLHPTDPTVGAVWAAMLTLLLTSLASAVSSWVRSDFLLRWAQLWLLLVLAVGTFQWRQRTLKARHPHACLDVAQAVAWIKQHLREHVSAADPERLFLSGHSAGAHLVSLLASDGQYLQAAGLPGTPSDHIRGVCAVSGIYCLHAPVAPSPGALRNRFFRFAYTAAFGGGKEALDAASPLHLVRAGAPPFLLISAASDMGLEMDAARFARRLAELRVPVQHHSVPNTSHSTIASHFERHQAHRHYVEFVMRCCADSGRQAKAQAQTEQQRQRQRPITAGHEQADGAPTCCSPKEGEPSADDAAPVETHRRPAWSKKKRSAKPRSIRAE